jgi:hypothetical protein
MSITTLVLAGLLSAAQEGAPPESVAPPLQDRPPRSITAVPS